MELDDITLERAFGKVCCRPMKDKKAARYTEILKSACTSKPTRGRW